MTLNRLLQFCVLFSWILLDSSGHAQPTDSAIVLQSWVGTSPSEQVQQSVEALVEALKTERAVSEKSYGQALAQQLGPHLPGQSTSLGSTESPQILLDRGKQFFIEGEYRAAATVLQNIIQQLWRQPQLLEQNQSLKKVLFHALLVASHTQLRLRDTARAKWLAVKAIVLLPNEPLSAATFAPELIRFVSTIKAKLNDASDLESNEAAQPKMISLDVAPALKIGATAGFQFADQKQQHKNEVAFASHVAQVLSIQHVYLITTSSTDAEQSMIELKLIAATTGQVIRASTIATTQQDAIVALAHYIATGDNQDALTDFRVRDTAPTRSSGFFSAGVWRWITLGTAVAAVGGAVPLWMINDKRSCNAPDSVRCPYLNYNTLVPAIALSATAGVSAIASAIFFYAHASAETPSSQARTSVIFSPWIASDKIGMGLATTY